MTDSYADLFSALTAAVELFIQEVKGKKSSRMATDEWSVKDELCHIVFWHECYAANYRALVKHETPVLPDKMSTINQRGVVSLRNIAIHDLIARLRAAHQSLFVSIVEKRVPRMTYSQRGRIYETEAFIAMITRHIAGHTKLVKRAK